ncbi:flagellar filament capping protein FliD [Paenibacillus sedimenti]|uniref:Flagellar hook-associated protein 2 n=1 Tax=Paenibacillus sedimenti TaxID=2770274 RepID=A0A926QMX5_9BACL|nr:flagellar filament capping protein FliD [Paenibacillus sedimenti]MBD0384162.1 flagellar filament capping protein FliD [Paenibacillus sedimenti]
MVFRIGGLASGMDTDTMISELMKAHRIPVDKLTQKRQTTIWQRESYLELNTKLYDFRNNKLFEFKKESTLTAKKVDTTGDSSVLSAKATGTASTGTLNVKVDTVAVAAMKWSTGDIRNVPLTNFDPSKKLVDEDADLSGDLTKDDYTIKINGTDISFNRNNDSLNDIISRINSSSAKVTAYYSNGKVSFSSKETGLINGTGHIQFVDDNGFLQNVLKVDTASNTPTVDSTQGVDAKAFINGIETTSSSNVLTVNGVELTLKAKSGATDTVINITSDTDKVIESIKGFIKDYNEMLKSLQDKVGESKYRDYTPLSDEQKKDMQENDIKLWEEKAKSGLLKNDSILTRTISEMRYAASGKVDTGSSKYNTLSSIGIETGLYSEKGKLYLNDEAKLRKALEEDPNAVTALFTANGVEGSNGSDVGIAERMYTTFQNALDDIKDRTGVSSILNDTSILGKQMNELGQQIDKYNSRLIDIENRYYRQFTAMEQAINRLNAQSANLAKQFG